jgi:hypothetical protein
MLRLSVLPDASDALDSEDVEQWSGVGEFMADFYSHYSGKHTSSKD